MGNAEPVDVRQAPHDLGKQTRRAAHGQGRHIDNMQHVAAVSAHQEVTDVGNVRFMLGRELPEAGLVDPAHVGVVLRWVDPHRGVDVDFSKDRFGPAASPRGRF